MQRLTNLATDTCPPVLMAGPLSYLSLLLPLIRNSILRHFVLNAWILLSVSASRVHIPSPYSRIVSTTIQSVLGRKLAGTTVPNHV